MANYIVLSLSVLLILSINSSFLLYLIPKWLDSPEMLQMQETNVFDQRKCEWNETNIKFINCNDSLQLQHSVPPYLISFEGSGNTYTRLVVELITNYYTGSVHTIDEHLFKAGFKGDGHCDDSVVVLKAHAWVFARRLWSQFINGTTNECAQLRDMNHIKRCNHNHQGIHSMNAIFLVRNPWNSFLSEFQRSTAILKRRSNNHVYNMRMDEFDVQLFEKQLFEFTEKYIQILEIYEQFTKMGRDTLFLVFENMEYEMINIIQFLFTDEHLQQHLIEYQRRIECIHHSDGLLRTQHIKRPHVMDLNHSDLYLTKQKAYAQVNQSTICNIWHRLHTYMVKFDLIRFGYGSLVEKYNWCT
eukprot:103108_1